MHCDITNQSSDRSGVAARRRGVLFLACLGTVCAAAAYVGAVPTRKFGHDIFFLLDNGWRVINGQRPHLDFTSAWGPVAYFIAAFGLALSHYSVDGIGYGNASFALVISLWGYRLSREAMEYPARFFTCLYLALLVVAPYPLGWGVSSSSFAMLYNRYGYALLALLMVEAVSCKVRTEQTALKEDPLGAFSSGAVAALAFFLKANYFVAAILILAVAAIAAPPSGRRLTGMVGGFLLTSLLFLCYLGFDVAAIRGDLEMAAGARAAGFTWMELGSKLVLNVPSLLFMLLLCVLGVRAARRQARPVKMALAGPFIFAIDMLLLASNQQYLELPLTSLWALFVGAEASGLVPTDVRGPAAGDGAPSRGVIIAGGAFFLFFFCSQLTGLGHGVAQKLRPPGADHLARFTAPPLRSLLLYDDAGEPASNGGRYVAYVNSGVRLLEQHTGPDETVLTIDMMNPFPYALQRPAPRGGMAAAAFWCTLSEKHRPFDARFFGATDLVMVPKEPASQRQMFDGLMAAYHNGLQERFRLVAESDMWLLYRRKDAVSATLFQRW